MKRTLGRFLMDKKRVVGICQDESPPSYKKNKEEGSKFGEREEKGTL